MNDDKKNPAINLGDVDETNVPDRPLDVNEMDGDNNLPGKAINATEAESSDNLPDQPTAINEVDEVTSEIDTVDEPTTQINTEEDVVTSGTSTPQTQPSDTWLPITNGKFTCSECENEVEPETNTIEGVVKADLNQIQQDLEQYPTKVVYGICPVCGMEFVFRHKDGQLSLEPSDMEK